MARPQGHKYRRHDFGGDAEAQREPAAHRPGGQYQAPGHGRGDQGVVGVTRQRERGKRECRPCDGQGEPQAPSTKSPPGHHHPQQRQGVKQRGGGVRGWQVIPFAMKGLDDLKWHVGQVVERAVGIALPAVLGEVAVRGRPVLDEIRADHACVPHVNHVAIKGIEAPAQREEHHQYRHQQPRGHPTGQTRPAGGARGSGIGWLGLPPPALGRTRPLHGDEHHAGQQVDEWQVLQGHRREDVAVVEVPPRDAE